MRIHRLARATAVGLVLVLALGACGKSKSSSSSSTAKKATIRIGSEKFSESVIMAEVYAGALEAQGYTVDRKLRLGTREVYEQAAENNQIDLFPDYAATLLEFLNKNAGEATSDPKATVAKLQTRLAPRGLTALDPAPAVDSNAFAVTKATADKYHLAKMSDLAAVAGQMKLGAPSNCGERPYCAIGLKNTYGIVFKELLAFEFDSPQVKDALAAGKVDVAEVGTTDADVAARGFVMLEDDKHLQLADALTPIIRTKALTGVIRTALDKVSAAMTTSELSALDKRADVDKEDPETVAHSWLTSKGFVKK
jgi:osmoprotectant transport system substrate-binding protein